MNLFLLALSTVGLLVTKKMILLKICQSRSIDFRRTKSVWESKYLS